MKACIRVMIPALLAVAFLPRLHAQEAARQDADLGRVQAALNPTRHLTRQAVEEAWPAADTPVHDPTRLSPRFRQALRAATPGSPSRESPAPTTRMPRIALIGLAAGGASEPSALIKVHDETFFVGPGTELTVTGPGGQPVFVRVVAVTEHDVRVRLAGRLIILR